MTGATEMKKINSPSKKLTVAVLTVTLFILTSCAVAPTERTRERPVMPDLSDRVITLAPGAPYRPSVMPEEGEWPTRPLTLIVPFLPGGDTDMYARMFAPQLAEVLGQPVYVMNIDGGSGTEGAKRVRGVMNDGYTFLFYHTGNLFANVLTGTTELNYHDFDIATIAMHCNANIFVVRSDLGINTAREFISHIHANPGSLDVATTITGFSFKLLRIAEIAGGFQTNPVHVGGGSMMAPSILAGHTQVGYNNIALFLPYIESGEMLPLWVAANERNALLPDVPTIAEIGIPDGFIGRSYFFAFPRGVDEIILQRLSDAVFEITNDPAFQAQVFDAVGLPTYFIPFGEAQAYLTEKWNSVRGLGVYMR
ncbi:MAG: tripartite tricarboxylate transporter substrate binding protein [Defluviitaleaceae bacterium]|nr:tripartite tricarboxylate transporter substrate binding protein [Defluviitaleaceae bacterium]MCL2263084.1 tripartite tricarboxylate transporter substrate binding protein [Defluviitaleaceae bacterium]